METHGDFWDNVSAFMTNADDECSKKVMAGNLGAFETAWADPIAKLKNSSWFVDAKPIPRKIAARDIRVHIRSLAEYTSVRL